MARNLPTALHVARHVLCRGDAWLLFCEIPLRDGVRFFRLVAAAKHVAADGKVWQAAGFRIDLPAEDGEGSLGTLTLRIPNVSRVPLAYVEAEDEVLGQTLTVWLQHEGSLAEFAPALSWRHRVLRVIATEAELRVECGHPLEIVRAPMRRFTRKEFPGLLPQGGVGV